MNRDLIGIISGKYKVVGMRTGFRSFFLLGKHMEEQLEIGNGRDQTNSLRLPITSMYLTDVLGGNGAPGHIVVYND
jgi:hypothetical protein